MGNWRGSQKMRICLTSCSQVQHGPMVGSGWFQPTEVAGGWSIIGCYNMVGIGIAPLTRLWAGGWSVNISHFLTEAPLRLAPTSPTSSPITLKHMSSAFALLKICIPLFQMVWQGFFVYTIWCVLGHVAVRAGRAPSPGARPDHGGVPN